MTILLIVCREFITILLIARRRLLRQSAQIAIERELADVRLLPRNDRFEALFFRGHTGGAPAPLFAGIFQKYASDPRCRRAAETSYAQALSESTPAPLCFAGETPTLPERSGTGESNRKFHRTANNHAPIVNINSSFPHRLCGPANKSPAQLSRILLPGLRR